MEAELREMMGEIKALHGALMAHSLALRQILKTHPELRCQLGAYSDADVANPFDASIDPITREEFHITTRQICGQ